MTRIYPRIADEAAMRILASLEGRNARDVESLVQLRHPEQVFPPVGGTEVTEAQLLELRRTVVGLATRYGFPGSRPRRTALFDREAAGLLHSEMKITPHEAASREMWSFIACCLLVDVAVWRFPKVTPNRFLGDVNRNAFRRLWWRVEVLGEPPDPAVPDPLWDLEDALVQLMERPGLSGHPDVGRAIADAFRTTADRVPANRHQDLMRDFQLRVMRRTAFVSLDLIDPAGREALLAGLAEEACDSLGETKPNQTADGQEPSSADGQESPREPSDLAAPEIAENSASDSAERFDRVDDRAIAGAPAGAVDLDDVPLDDLPRLILETVEQEQPVANDELPELIAARGFLVPRPRRRLLSSFAWYLAAKKALRQTDDGMWRINRSVALPEVCALSINKLAAEALSRGQNGSGNRLFEKIIDEVLDVSGRVPKPYTRAIGAAIKKADLG